MATASRSRSRRWILAFSAVLLGIPAVAAALPDAEFRTEVACPDDRTPDGPFVDVGRAHAVAAACLSWYGIAQGTTATTYEPLRLLNRGQVASIVVRTLDQVDGVTLPPPQRGRFSDVTSGPHRDAIERLAAAEPPILRGVTGDRYEPLRPVTRAQYASIVARALDVVAAAHDDLDPLPSATSDFPDVTGGAHANDIARLADAGVVEGFVDGRYRPAAALNRGQAANLTVRAVGGLVEARVMSIPATLPDLDVDVALSEVGQLASPVAGATGPDGVLYLASREGTVHPLRDDGVGPAVLDLSEETTTDGERGLLGIAFSDDGTELYTSSTNLAGDSVIQAFGVVDGQIDPNIRRVVYTAAQPDYANHNGGDVQVGPDGMLYIALGDGGGAGDPEDNGQDLSTPLGTILRLDPQGGDPYAIPDDNPFVGQDGVVEEIWSWGLRNPWRFSFDAVTGEMWIADVGQGAREEVNLLPAPPAGGGANFGWSEMEGTLAYDGGTEPEDHVPPVYEYETRGDQGCAITGGVVYRGSAITGLQGAYLYSDFCNGELRGLAQQDGRIVDQAAFDVAGEQVVAFAVDADDEVYLLDLSGSIWRLDAAS